MHFTAPGENDADVMTRVMTMSAEELSAKIAGLEKLQLRLLAANREVAKEILQWAQR